MVVYINGAEMSPYLQAQAKARYVHRFTADHKPAWASKPMPNGNAYPVQFASDADWLANTDFPVTKRGELSNRHKARRTVKPSKRLPFTPYMAAQSRTAQRGGVNMLGGIPSARAAKRQAKVLVERNAAYAAKGRKAQLYLDLIRKGRAAMVRCGETPASVRMDDYIADELARYLIHHGAVMGLHLFTPGARLFGLRIERIELTDEKRQTVLEVA